MVDQQLIEKNVRKNQSRGFAGNPFAAPTAVPFILIPGLYVHPIFPLFFSPPSLRGRSFGFRLRLLSLVFLFPPLFLTFSGRLPLSLPSSSCLGANSSSSSSFLCSPSSFLFLPQSINAPAQPIPPPLPLFSITYVSGARFAGSFPEREGDLKQITVPLCMCVLEEVYVNVELNQ